MSKRDSLVRTVSGSKVVAGRERRVWDGGSFSDGRRGSPAAVTSSSMRTSGRGARGSGTCAGTDGPGNGNGGGSSGTGGPRQGAGRSAGKREALGSGADRAPLVCAAFDSTVKAVAGSRMVCSGAGGHDGGSSCSTLVNGTTIRSDRITDTVLPAA